MYELAPDQARTLLAVAETGSLDAAAKRLHVSPSAISQRVRTLEVALGRPVLVRSRPVELTAAGRTLARYARQQAALAAELAAELGETGTPTVAVVINGDSLATWALPALTGVAERVRIRVLREDQDHSLALLRDGVVAGAVSADPTPVPGCRVRRLGVMRYRPVCSATYARRWFPDGVDAAALAVAPVVTYDDKDDLQDRLLRRYASRGSKGRALDPPRHHIPATHEFGEAVRLGLGWGMLPEQQLGDDIETGVLVPLTPTARVDVTLHWQQWRFAPAGLDEVAAALAEAAAATLR